MSLTKVTTEVTYKVPSWGHCNLQGNIFGQPSKDKCRFCVKEKGYYRCALYNEVLATEEGTLIKKVRACQKACASNRSVAVEETPTPSVDPMTIVKATIAEYNKIRRQLISQGYPEFLADKAASEYIIGGK